MTIDFALRIARDVFRSARLIPVGRERYTLYAVVIWSGLKAISSIVFTLIGWFLQFQFALMEGGLLFPSVSLVFISWMYSGQKLRVSNLHFVWFVLSQIMFSYFWSTVSVSSSSEFFNNRSLLAFLISWTLLFTGYLAVEARSLIVGFEPWEVKWIRVAAMSILVHIGCRQTLYVFSQAAENFGLKAGWGQAIEVGQILLLAISLAATFIVFQASKKGRPKATLFE
jgi:hypothetical protein